jgi:hypothetical protein
MISRQYFACHCGRHQEFFFASGNEIPKIEPNHWFSIFSHIREKTPIRKTDHEETPKSLMLSSSTGGLFDNTNIRPSKKINHRKPIMGVPPLGKRP